MNISASENQEDFTPNSSSVPFKHVLDTFSLRHAETPAAFRYLLSLLKAYSARDIRYRFSTLDSEYWNAVPVKSVERYQQSSAVGPSAVGDPLNRNSLAFFFLFSSESPRFLMEVKESF